MDPIDLLKLLLDPARLAVAGALAVRPATVDELVQVTGADERAVLGTLGALRRGGLVVLDNGRYQLDVEALRGVAHRVADVTPPPDPRIGYGMTEQEQTVLGRFFEGTRLREIPATYSKRLVVLERLALEFEPGRRYTEPEVNEILGAFHPDYATLRRALVDEGLLDRDAGEYWRSGGRVV